jgi:hypothetical protein
MERGEVDKLTCEPKKEAVVAAVAACATRTHPGGSWCASGRQRRSSDVAKVGGLSAVDVTRKV